MGNEAKVILISHLGRIKTDEDLKNNSLRIVSQRLSELISKNVKFIEKTRGVELEKAVNELKNGEILLMENTRFEDLDGEKESKNDDNLAKYWANLGDIFINDAFGTCHRSHASNVGIASNLPSGIGFLVEKEINILSNSINNPKRPLTVILGGAKVKDKINVIKNLVKIADYILIGGAMAYTFLKSQDIEVGKSIVDEENIDFCKEILAKYKDKIILPIDSINAKEISNDANVEEKFITDINKDDIGLDIGYNTVKLFKQYLVQSKTIIWNGTLGYSELEKFSNGTKNICEILKNIDCTKIIGGGDTGAAVINFGYQEYMTHISTGGGASLELLEGKKLPGIEIIDDV